MSKGRNATRMTPPRSGGSSNRCSNEAPAQRSNRANGRPHDRTGSSGKWSILAEHAHILAHAEHDAYVNRTDDGRYDEDAQ